MMKLCKVSMYVTDQRDWCTTCTRSRTFRV